MNDFHPRGFRGGALAVIEIGYGQRLTLGVVHKAFAESDGDTMGGGAVDLPVDHIRVDHGAIVANDKIAQHFDFARGFVHFDDGGVGAGRECKLRPHQAIGVGDDIGLGMGKHVVECRLQSRFHIVGDEMLIVVGDAAKFGEGDLFCRRAGYLYDTVFDG